jgi:hypothetical protein
LLAASSASFASLSPFSSSSSFLFFRVLSTLTLRV